MFIINLELCYLGFSIEEFKGYEMSLSSNNVYKHSHKLNVSKISKSFLIALQLGSFTCLSAYAQEVTISNERNTSISTSNADGGSAADIVIDVDGSIVVDSGTAITIDSDNDVTVNGNVNTNAQDDAIGINIVVPDAGTRISDLSINEAINVSTQGDNDNLGTNNYGLLIEGDGTLQGDIVFAGTGDIRVFGDNSAGISVQSDLDGSLTIDGVTITGDNSNAVEIFGNINGDIATNSIINARDLNGHGVYIGGDVTGAYKNIGSIQTGTDSARNFSTNVTTPAISGVASLRISSNLGGGFENRIAYFDFNGDEVNVAENESTAGFSTNTSNIVALGGGYGVLISPEKIDNSSWTDITLGNTNSFYGDYSFLNQGRIRARGVNIGQEATAVLITGATQGSTDYSTTLDFGFYNGLWGTIEAEAEDANAIIIDIGANTSIPEIVNNGTLTSITLAELDSNNERIGSGGDSYAIRLNETSQVNRFENMGTITSTAEGASTSAYGIIDNSGSIEVFRNTNFIRTAIEEDSTGQTIAVDLSKNTTTIDFDSSGQITGDVLLGSGTNTIELDGLTENQIGILTQEFIDDGIIEELYLPALVRGISGTLTLGNGTSTVNMTGNAAIQGGIFSPNGNLNVTLNDQSELRVKSTTPLNTENLTINDQSRLVVEIEGDGNFTGGVNASGDVVFGPDSQLSVEIASLILEGNTFEIITSNSLTIDSTSNIFNANDQLFIYDISSQIDATSLTVELRRKNAQELGLNQNLSEIYEASIPALFDNPEIASEISSVTTLEEFTSIYNQMMPNNLSQASRQILITNNSLSVGAVAGRLDNLRLLKRVPDGPLESGQGFWVQQYGSKYDFDNSIDEKPAYGFTFGLAAGYEIAVTDQSAFGISIAKNFADIKLDNAGLSRVGLENTQAGLYGAFWLSDIFIEAQANIGLLDFESDREVIFSDFDRTSMGEWDGLQYSSNLKIGYQLNLGNKFSLTPSAIINYTNIRQDPYTETGGGGGIDLSVSEFRTDSMIGTVEMEFAYTTDFSSGDDVVGQLSFGLHGGYSKEFRNDPQSITAQFAGYDDQFTLTGSQIPQNSYQAGAGIYFGTDITQFSLVYDADWREQYMAHIATMNFRLRF